MGGGSENLPFLWKFWGQNGYLLCDFHYINVTLSESGFSEIHECLHKISVAHRFYIFFKGTVPAVNQFVYYYSFLRNYA